MAINKKHSGAHEKEDNATVLRAGSEWTKRVNVDIPIWAIKELDKEAGRRGIARQALIKTWLIDKIDSIRDKKNVG